MPLAKKPSINVGEQRIYHVTHSSNLAAILASGALHADASDAWDSRPAVDISSEHNRAARRATVIDGSSGVRVADYVPFFLSPDASLWSTIRAGDDDHRLSPDIRGIAASEFVVLVTTVTSVAGARSTDAGPGSVPIVVADGDAADSGTRCTTARDAYERMLRQLITNEDVDAVRHAELLVKDTVPFSAISLIGVINERTRDTVKTILASSEFSPRVAVHPPWFAAPAE